MIKKRQRIAQAPRLAAGIPVFCIGNLVVGGSGKSPILASIAEALQGAGWKPGIVSRGYGGRVRGLPVEVRPDSAPERVGDEPVMLKQRLGCPVVVCRDRARAVDWLVRMHAVDVILSDDGLQNTRLWRDFSICVFNVAQGIGNGRVLPFGPLREPLSVLSAMDALVVRGADAPEEALAAMGVESSTPSFGALCRATTAYRSDAPGETVPLRALAAKGPWHAVAGIASPDIFFQQLTDAGLPLSGHGFTDHHAYQPKDLVGLSPIITTEKDAVKLVHLVKEPFWIVRLDCEHPELTAWIVERLNHWRSL